MIKRREMEINMKKIKNVETDFISSSTGYPILYEHTHFRYHIKGSTGNDNNDGRTANTAYKTIEKALEDYNNGSIDVRMYIDEPGEYIFSGVVLGGGGSLHISATVADVCITFKHESQENNAFYNMHLNIEGASTNSKLTIKGNDFYFDGGTVNMTNVIINPLITVLGGYLSTDQCHIRALVARASFLRLHSTYWSNIDPNVRPFYCEDCMVRLYGTTNFANLKSTGTQPWVNAAASHFVQMHAFSNAISNKYTKAYDFDSCTFNITKSRLNSYTNIAKQEGSYVNTMKYSE